MSRLRISLMALLALVFLAFPVEAISQQPLPVPGANGPPPVKPSTFTPIAAQLNQLLSGNAAAATTSLAVTTSNAAAATTTGDSSDESTEPPPVETFGTRALSLLLSFGDLVGEQATVFAENFADLPQASQWYDHQLDDGHLRERWGDAGRDLLIVVLASFVGAFVFELLLLPLRRHFRRKVPATVLKRVSAGLVLLSVELLPVILFVVVSLTMLDQREPFRLPRFVVLNVIYAITLDRLIMVMGNFLLSPRAMALRLVPVTQAGARYLYRWLRSYSLVIVYGYFCVDVAHSIRVPSQAVNAFGALLGLILVIMTIVVIMQQRAFVAVALRGNLSAARKGITPAQGTRLWLARSWHLIAITYLVIGYVVTALGVQGGFAIMLRGTVLTAIVFLITGIAFSAIGRIGIGRGEEAPKPQIHHNILRFFLRLSVWIVAVGAAAAGWGASITALLSTPFGQRVSSSFVSIAVTVILLALIYGYVNSSIERHLNRKDKDGRPVQASARMRTLLPMIRNAAFIGFSIVAGIVILSEAGFDIAPLLAGAGVIGVAVGFGSQTLVKDFITGLFIVIENTIAVGDVVKIGDHSGVVEAMTIRTIRLRDNDGSVHILPFSEITKLINMTRDFAYAVLDINVAYNTDLRRAMEIIRETGDTLSNDALFKYDITEPIEVSGIETMGDYAITLRSRIRTRPGRQWDVKRAFLLRIKERLDAEKIEIPLPTAMRIVRQDGKLLLKDGE